WRRQQSTFVQAREPRRSTKRRGNFEPPLVAPGQYARQVRPAPAGRRSQTQFAAPCCGLTQGHWRGDERLLSSCLEQTRKASEFTDEHTADGRPPRDVVVSFAAAFAGACRFVGFGPHFPQIDDVQIPDP